MPDEDKIDLSMFLDDYVSDAREGFQRVNTALIALETDNSRTEGLDDVFRVVHTLKSSSTMLEFSDIAELAHICEDLLERLRKKDLPVTQGVIDLLFEVTDTLEAMVKGRAERKSESAPSWGPRIAEIKGKITAQKADTESNIPAPKPVSKTDAVPTIEKIQTVRVHVDLLDSLFNLVGELIITKNRIDNLLAGGSSKEVKAPLAEMDRLIKELQENVSAARLVPVDEIFQKFPRMMRDLARGINKEVELVIEGREIEFDKAVLDAISEPVAHLLRNAVDHGIESPDERLKRNKRRLGTIRLTAKRAENRILIEVEDDGGGIDIARIKEVAEREGFAKPEEAESLQGADLLDLLSTPGLTSAKEVTDVSGRGVGLDVVRTSVERLSGTVEMTTKKGQGTRFTLKLPLSTAIMQTLMVGVGEHLFAIPSDDVLQAYEIKPTDIKEIGNQQVLTLREEIIPFVKLNEVFNIPRLEGQMGMIAVIVHIGDRLISLGVDALVGQVENIIRPFDPVAQQFKGFSGGTILGDGRVALLLNIPTLFGFEKLVGERQPA